MEVDIRATTTTQLKSGVPNYKVQPRVIDEAGVQPETYWDSPSWSIYLGYLKTIPEYRNAVRSLATWAFGRGWQTDSESKVILEHLAGWGEDTFDSIIQDLMVMKKTNGDAFAEIIRDDKKDVLINLKKLNPSKVRIVVNPKGLITAYDIMQADGKWHRVKTTDVFHISNDRIANEIHGTSVLESCKWVIDWKNEMLADLRRVMHRSTIRVLYIDEDDVTKLGIYREQYKEAIKNGDILIMPGKPTDGQFQDLTIPPTEAWLNVIRYADNYFYEILGVSKTITGGIPGNSEIDAKMGYLAFEQPVRTEARLMEQDIWNQLGIKITFNRSQSLKEDIQTSDAANTSQVGMQPNETQATVSRTE